MIDSKFVIAYGCIYKGGGTIGGGTVHVVNVPENMVLGFNSKFHRIQEFRTSRKYSITFIPSIVIPMPQGWGVSDEDIDFGGNVVPFM